MPNQKALVLPTKNGDYQLGENVVPTPGPRDLLVKIISSALNPVDWKIQGEYSGLLSSYPAIGGSDGAGVVEEHGSEVSGFSKGDRVLFQGFFSNDKATFQQYAIVPAEITAKIPDNISFDQAASVPLALATISIGLWNHDPHAKSAGFPAPWEEGGEPKFADKPAFILGGASSVGQYAIQLARLNKFSPIITTASLHNESLLKSLGATHVLDRFLAPSAIISSLKDITGGVPIEYVHDTVSIPDTQTLAYEALAPGGVLIIVLQDVIPAELKKDSSEKKIVNVAGNVHFPQNRQIGIEVYKRLTGWLRDGVIVPNSVEVLPNGLAGITDGLERLKQNKVSALKLIAHPQETA